ncbi:MAG: hypothetical protein ABI596_03635 [Pyrinomonadaceae bacterium]
MPPAKLPYLKSAVTDKANSYRWAGGLSINAYGVRVGIRTNSAKALQAIPSFLPLGWKPAASLAVERLYSIVMGRAGAHSFHILYENEVEIARAEDPGILFDRLESSLRLYVAEMSTRRVFVHAGVVAVANRAIIMPARSLGGKSSLTAEFIRAGAVYYSDEYAVLDSRGRVHPYAKPISIREGENYSQTDYPVESFGGVAGKHPLPVGLVILTTYKKGARWRPAQLSAGQGVLAMLDHTVSARRNPDRALDTLSEVVKQAKVIKGMRGEAQDVVKSVLASLKKL